MESMFGSISLHSLGLFFPKYNRDELHGIYVKYGDGVKLTLNNYDFNSIAAYDTNIILTDIHEFDHFFQLISSPFGVLLFRIYNVLTSDTLWIGRQFDEFGIKVTNHRKDLLTWLKDECINNLRQAIPGTSKKSWLPYYIEGEVIPGMRSIEKLLLLLTSKKVPEEFKDLTVEGFCEILNDSNLYLRKRCDIDIKYESINNSNWEDVGFIWESELHPSAKIFKEGSLFLSPSNILETIAYLHEFRLMTRNNANELIIQNWYNKRVPDYCRNILSYFLQLFDGDPSSARAYLSCFLDTNLDITTGEVKSNRAVQLVESEWAFFYNLVNINIEESYLSKLNNSILGFETIINRKQLFGVRSNWRDFTNKSFKQADYSNHLLQIESSFLKALERKLRLKIGVRNGQYGTLVLDDLILLIESKNDFNIKNINVSKIQDENYFISTVFPAFHPIIPTIAIRILNGMPVLCPVNRSKKLTETIQNICGEKVTKETINIIKQPLENLFDKEHIKKMFIGIDIVWYTPVT